MKDASFSHTLISYDLLTAIGKNTELYNINTHEGLTALKQLAYQLALREVKSLRGTFEQSKVVGFCLATNWINQNKEALLQEDTNAIRDLFYLSSVIMKDQAGNKDLKAFFQKANLDSCLTKGFECGIRLGQQVARNLQASPIHSTETLIKQLYMLQEKDPLPVQRISHQKPKNSVSIPRRTRQNQG